MLHPEPEFRRICNGATGSVRYCLSMPSPQENRTFKVLKRNFFCSGREKIGQGFEDWGLKLFPPESEKPR